MLLNWRRPVFERVLFAFRWVGGWVAVARMSVPGGFRGPGAWHGWGHDDGSGCFSAAKPLQHRDAEVLIGILAVLEGAIWAGSSGEQTAGKVAEPFAQEGLRCRQWLAVLGALDRQSLAMRKVARASVRGIGAFFGHVVSGVDGVPGQVVGPVRPDGEGVSMEFFEVVVF